MWLLSFLASSTLLLLATMAASASSSAHTQTSDPTIARLFEKATRSTTWTPKQTIPLSFPTFHPQGIAITPDYYFLSSVEVLEQPVKYPTPQGGYDRSPGRGIGHVFVLTHDGALVKDITLQDGDKYHPGGIDSDGQHVWVPLAEYRPNSAASVYRISLRDLSVTKMFDADDHYGGLLWDKSRHLLVGNTWGSRNFTAWTSHGHVVEKWANPTFYVDFQDGQYIEGGKALMGGVASLPGVSSGSSYELGGLCLVDLHSKQVLHEVPVTLWSKAAHSITRNPMKMWVRDSKLNLLVAPDDGEDVGGTELLFFEATV